MKLVLQPLLVAALVLTLASPAYADECGDIRMPARIQVDGTALALNGMGIREATVFNVDVYVAGLYLETRSRTATTVLQSEQRKRLLLHFVRDVTRDEIQGAFREGFQQSHGAAAADITRLLGWVSNMSVGQEMSFTYLPATGLEVKIGGRVKGTIAGADFTRAFFGIWLGSHPPNSGLKRGLLGGSC